MSAVFAGEEKHMSPKTAPWKTKNPVKKANRTKLTEEQKDEARERAKKAGRRYPNLVDNMAVAKEAKKAETDP